jgi:hypothetical protein
VPGRDPPPDLAVEVDVTSSSVDRMHIYGFRSKNRDVTTDRHAPRRKT